MMGGVNSLNPASDRDLMEQVRAALGHPPAVKSVDPVMGDEQNFPDLVDTLNSPSYPESLSDLRRYGLTQAEIKQVEVLGWTVVERDPDVEVHLPRLDANVKCRFRMAALESIRVPAAGSIAADSVTEPKVKVQTRTAVIDQNHVDCVWVGWDSKTNTAGGDGQLVGHAPEGHEFSLYAIPKR